MSFIIHNIRLSAAAASTALRIVGLNIKKENNAHSPSNISSDSLDTSIPLQVPEDGPVSRRWTCKADILTSQNVTKHDDNTLPSRHLILICTGENFSSNDYMETRLTHKGRDQANVTGRHIKQLHLPVARILHSTYRSAAETVDEIAAYMPLVSRESSDLLRDGHPNLPDSPLPVLVEEPGLATMFADNARAAAAFQRYFAPPPASSASAAAVMLQKKPSYDILVCHCSVIRYFLSRALDLRPDTCRAIGLDNCSLTWVTIRSDGRVIVKSVGDRGHLLGDKIK